MLKSLKICLPVIALLLGCGSHEKTVDSMSAGVSSAHVSLATVARQPITRTFDAVGTVRSKTTSDLQSKIMAQVKAVHVVPGDKVVTGQLLVELDDRELSAQLQRAESALRETESARHEIDQSILAATANQSVAEAGRDLAETTHSRFKTLSDTNAVSRQAYDETAAKKRESVAGVNRATGQRKAIEAKRGEVTAQIQAAQADLERARTLLSYTRIVAPFDGLVTAKDVESGDMASPGQRVLQIEDPLHYRIEASIDETRFTSLGTACSVGSTLPVVINALDLQPVNGTVVEIVPAADPRTRSFLIKVDLPVNEKLRAGMFARIRFPYGQQDVLCIPRAAVVQRGQLTSVFVVGEDHHARLRLVTLGIESGGLIEVLSGLTEGEQIAVSETEALRDGQPITSQKS